MKASKSSDAHKALKQGKDSVPVSPWGRPRSGDGYQTSQSISPHRSGSGFPHIYRKVIPARKYFVAVPSGQPLRAPTNRITRGEQIA
jgi:hypothetical protein